MSKLILYVATSLDGYIARKDGGVDWLAQAEDTGYEEFLQSIDTIIMGRESYNFVENCGFWPYEGKTCYVLTHKEIKNPIGDIITIKGQADQVYVEIRESAKSNIWLMGGSQIASQFRQCNLIDEYWLYVHPVWLGEGIPLFTTPLQEEQLQPVSNRQLSHGLIELIYKRN